MNQEQQRQQEEGDSNFTQSTGWGFEAGWGRLFIAVQWIGLFERWCRPCPDGSTISYWICLYSRKSPAVSMISLIINPLKLSMGLTSKEEDIEAKEETPS